MPNDLMFKYQVDMYLKGVAECPIREKCPTDEWER